MGYPIPWDLTTNHKHNREWTRMHTNKRRREQPQMNADFTQIKTKRTRNASTGNRFHLCLSEFIRGCSRFFFASIRGTNSRPPRALEGSRFTALLLDRMASRRLPRTSPRVASTHRLPYSCPFVSIRGLRFVASRAVLSSVALAKGEGLAKADAIRD